MTLRSASSLASVLALGLLLPAAAFAADDELDEEERSSRGSKAAKDEVVREIERGFFAKSNVGGAFYLLNFGSKPTSSGNVSILSGGTYTSLSVGQEFVDKERSSIAWEAGVAQGIHNGLNWQVNEDFFEDGELPPSSVIQGDTRTFTLGASLEYSAYPTRRFGVGARVGGGVLLAPLFLDPGILGEMGDEFRAQIERVHGGVHPVVFGGPTIEYYTKLSHFSLGADIDVTYGIGFDLGLQTSGYMKYTF